MQPTTNVLCMCQLTCRCRRLLVVSPKMISRPSDKCYATSVVCSDLDGDVSVVQRVHLLLSSQLANKGIIQF